MRVPFFDAEAVVALRVAGCDEGVVDSGRRVFEQSEHGLAEVADEGVVDFGDEVKGCGAGVGHREEFHCWLVGGVGSVPCRISCVEGGGIARAGEDTHTRCSDWRLGEVRELVDVGLVWVAIVLQVDYTSAKVRNRYEECPHLGGECRHRVSPRDIRGKALSSTEVLSPAPRVLLGLRILFRLVF